MLFGGAFDTLSLQRASRDAVSYTRFSQSAIAADLPHLADFLNFLRAELAVVEFPDFLF